MHNIYMKSMIHSKKMPILIIITVYDEKDQNHARQCRNSISLSPAITISWVLPSTKGMRNFINIQNNNNNKS
jgi:hypothetical protein